MANYMIGQGFLMIIDTTQERGMDRLELRFQDPDACHFPLINALTPLSVDWMHVVYLTMIIASICICIGFYYRFVTIWLAVCYWYVFLLDKTTWNNHSYLFGLFALFFTVTKANRWCSVDGRLDKSIQNAHIPRWHLGLFQFQIFLVYFYAGIKKLDPDWISGNSMVYLESHWVFSPFHYILTAEQVNLYIVHFGGFAFDLLEGILLFFNTTRPIGMAFGCYFHVANACMFNIGIFPYAMLATLPIFCNAAWPKKIIAKLSKRWQSRFILDPPDNYSSPDCYYDDKNCNKCGHESATDKQAIKSNNSDQESTVQSTRLGIRRFTKKNKFTMLALSAYVALQLFLPFSHGVTKGYTGWDNHGLYGYSWDMMVKTWATQHIKVKVVDLSTGEQFFLKPSSFISGPSKINQRWNSHPDMIKQYATCIGRHVRKLGVKQPAVYFDVWKSMNRRFKQRTVDPDVDILSAPWSPFTKPTWMMPLLNDLTWWRTKMIQLDEELLSDDVSLSTNYVADFPGLALENFVPPSIQVNLTVLQGKVRVHVGRRGNYVQVNQTAILPSNQTHEVRVVSKEPASYYYVFKNVTLEKLVNEKIEAENKTKTQEGTSSSSYKFLKPYFVPIVRYLYHKGALYYHLANNTINAISNILRNCNCNQNSPSTIKP